jgi:hypothetical protein
VSEHEDRIRDLKIAQNEADRELASDMRLSVWAISAAAILGLIVLAFFLMVS